MASPGRYGRLKGFSRSLTNRHQSWVKRFVVNFRIEWCPSDWNQTKNDWTMPENVCMGDWELLYKLCDLTWYSYMQLDLQKPVLLSITGSVIFHTNSKPMRMHYQIWQSQLTRVQWSAFASCFCQAQWWAERAIGGLDKVLANQEMAAYYCTTLWYWITTCAINFLSLWPFSALNGLKPW